MSEKTVSQVDRMGHFVGLTQADESPLEHGVYLLPAGCVDAIPTAQWPDDKWPRWTGSTWALVNRPRAPEQAPEQDPIAKLRAFLDANPDVAQLIDGATLQT